MKTHTCIALFLMLGFVLVPQHAEAKHLRHTPHHAAVKHHHHSAGVDRGAGYADIVIDAETGRVVHETDSDSLRHPASLTKMMTLYITFQALESGHFSLGQYLPVTENASYQSPSKLGLHAGQHIRVEDAVLGLVTESANDAAVVLGEALGGSEEGFAQLMTKQARALGMTKTVFRNPSGLPDPDQVTTAHDMAVLGDALINHYPQFYPYFSHESFTYAGIYHHNHNHLMSRYSGMDGIKTGYIRASGFNLVASARRNGRRLIGVIFGGHSAVARDNSMAQLLDRSFVVAQAEGASGRMPAANGEGDSSDSDTGDYVTLPAKVSAIFPAHGAGVAGAQAQVRTLDPEPPSPPAPAAASVPVPVPVPVAAAAEATTAELQQPQAQPATALSPVASAAATPAAAPKNVLKPPATKSATKVVPLVPQKLAMLAPSPTSQVAPHAPSSNWGIQIGAYSDPAIGRQALSDLTATMSDVLSAADPQVQKVSAGGTVMYRARLMSLDKKTAQSVCSFLIQHGKSCLTVEP